MLDLLTTATETHYYPIGAIILMLLILAGIVFIVGKLGYFVFSETREFVLWIYHGIRDFWERIEDWRKE